MENKWAYHRAPLEIHFHDGDSNSYAKLKCGAFEATDKMIAGSIETSGKVTADSIEANNVTADSITLTLGREFEGKESQTKIFDLESGLYLATLKFTWSDMGVTKTVTTDDFYFWAQPEFRAQSHSFISTDANYGVKDVCVLRIHNLSQGVKFTTLSYSSSLGMEPTSIQNATVDYTLRKILSI